MLNRTLHLALVFLVFSNFLATFKASSTRNLSVNEVSDEDDDDDETQVNVDPLESDEYSVEAVDSPFMSSDSEHEETSESNEESSVDLDETRWPPNFSHSSVSPTDSQLLILPARGASSQVPPAHILASQRINQSNGMFRDANETHAPQNFEISQSFVTPPRLPPAQNSEGNLFIRSPNVLATLPHLTQNSQPDAQGFQFFSWKNGLMLSSSLPASLTILEADLASDPILAERVQRFIISEHRLPMSGLVARDSGQNIYFYFPFHQRNFISRPLSIPNFFQLSQALANNSNDSYNSPVVLKRKAESINWPEPPSSKRVRPFGQFEPIHYIQNRLDEAATKGANIPQSSSLRQYLTVFNGNLARIELKENYLIAFEHRFDDIFMEAFNYFKIQMRLSAMILALLPGSDFKKFQVLRKHFDLEPRESKDFAEGFLRAIMVLPAVSNEALTYLTSPVNAPFLFNHECSAQSSLYAGKFCFEQVAGVVHQTKTQFPGANPLVTALLSELKKPFQLTPQIAVMAISHFSFLKNVCFDDKEKMLNFYLQLLNMYLNEKFVQESTSSDWLEQILQDKLALKMLELAVQNEAEESIINLYSVFAIEFEVPFLLSRSRKVSMKANSPLFYVIVLENEIKDFEKTYYDSVVTLLPKSKE